MNERQILKPAGCADLIRHSRSVVALTGAGISTAAGIPDFRGPQGLYVTRRYEPEKVFDIRWFRHDPRYFYEFARDFVDLVSAISPTFVHRFLAKLEAAGILNAVISQNIDMLHQSAGSRKVIELHGSYGSASCGDCGRYFNNLTYIWWDEAMRTSPHAPVAECPTCRQALKPDIVFFGEMVKDYVEAERRIAECDLLLVLGSSLTVSPASFLPLGGNGTTVVVNRGPVSLEPESNRYFIDGDVDAYFLEVAASLEVAAK
jgi:NAD-dependent deacetylase